jgi:hypothetical protein
LQTSESSIVFDFMTDQTKRDPLTTVLRSPEMRSRLMGFLPLAFFIAQGVHYWKIGQLGHMLWMCNIGNLLLAVGILANRPSLIRVAFLWMIPGIVIWFFYVVLTWGVFFSSILAHVGGLIIGLVAVRRVGMDRGAWLYAFGWYLVIQLLSRLITSPDLNVNLSQRIAEGWEKTFTSYWKFWIVLTIAVAATLWIQASIVRKLWPTRES